MPSKKAANSGAVIGIVLLLVIIAIVYLSVSGSLNLGGLYSNQSPSQTSTYTTTVSPSSLSLLNGRSGSMLLTYFNPFTQALNPNVTLSVGSPTFVSVNTPSIKLSMPAAMSVPAATAFNVTCTGSGQVSTSEFSVSLDNFTQNATTSVETYPYGSNPLQVIGPSVSPGFLSITANPITIETSASSPASSPINIQFSPAVYSGNVFSGSSTGIITSLTVSISNTSGGVASAFVQYGSNTLNLAGHSTLSITIPDVNLALISAGLSLKITATNSATPTQNLISIITRYNYQYSFVGPTISCE